MAQSFQFADPPVLQTDRLRLRGWRPEDLAPFAAINADPAVMRYFPALLSTEESDALAASIQDRFRAWAFGFWVVETTAIPFAGFIGLSRPIFDPAVQSAVEVGWRLSPQAWGQGLATEGARLALSFGFQRCGLDEIVAYAPLANHPSIRVMQRLGMETDPVEDFDHPGLAGHPDIRRCALHRLSRSRFEAGRDRA